jgi:arylsulfatase A-like enzyme
MAAMSWVSDPFILPVSSHAPTHINRTQLFDLRNDPDELHNLADDPAHAARIDRLTARLRAWQEQFGDRTPLTSENPRNPAFTPPE